METIQSFEFDRMVATQAAVATLNLSTLWQQSGPPGIILSSHLEAKLASWALMLRDAGARVAIAPSNAASTVEAEALQMEQIGIPVFRRPDYHQITAEFWKHVVAFAPNLVFDDGALLIRHCVDRRAEVQGMQGAVEFTTSGHDNLKEMSAAGLPWPVFDLGLSYCKHEIGNVYGTGISTMTAISYATNVSPAAKVVLVIGYGAVGRSVADTAQRLACRVIVFDNNVKNLARAHFDGHEICSLEHGLCNANIVITCSGSAGALTAEHLLKLADQTIVANVGCFSEEIDLAGLAPNITEVRDRPRNIQTYMLRNNRRLHILARAELVNLAIGRGWPIELIDLTFALSTLCFPSVLSGRMPPGLLEVPWDLEEAALRLYLSKTSQAGAAF